METQTFPSDLQRQYPLSPRKFWKKIIEKLFLGFVGAFFLGALTFAIVLVVMVNQAGDTPETTRSAVLVTIGLVAFIWLAIMLLYAWYVRIYIHRYYYDANEAFITIRKGVFAPAEIHVQYAKIQDVYVDQDVIDRVLGLYDVHLASATVASGMEAHIDGVEVAAAEGLKNFLLENIRGGGQSIGSQTIPSSSRQTSALGTPKPLDASHMISSNQYPIQPRWMGMQVVAALFHALWASAVIVFYIGVKSKATWDQNWLVLGLVIFVIIFIFQIIYNAIWKNNFHFAFLSDYIQLSTQVIAKSEQHMPYSTVQDVIIKQGVLERTFGLATVSIQNAAANQQARTLVWGRSTGSQSQAVNIPGQNLVDANKIAEIIRSIALTKNTGKTGL